MKHLMLLAALCLSTPALAEHPLIAQLLAQDKAPPGVVFEIVTGDPQALRWAIPEVSNYAKQLRERFPKLGIAVVTHGQEMFALQTDKRSEASTVHAEIEQLVKEQHIPVHVCETYAGWRGVGAEAFPDYINVAATGPAQVKNYLALNYVLIKISAPSNEQATP